MPAATVMPDQLALRIAESKVENAGDMRVFAERRRLALGATGELLQFGPQGSDGRLQFAHLPLQRVDALLLLDRVQQPDLRQPKVFEHDPGEVGGGTIRIERAADNVAGVLTEGRHTLVLRDALGAEPERLFRREL